VDGELQQPEVVVQPEAAAFIRDNGGRVFVWADASGLEHVRFHRPAGAIAWNEIHADGVMLLVDPSIMRPKVWTIVFRRFPYRRIEVLYDARSSDWVDVVAGEIP
jgi:hypothetical protein